MPTLPTFIIAGTQSGVGKTSIAIGLMRSLTRRGLRVQPFKVGPDFIDPGHHQRATGRVSHNLDGWMLDRTANVEIAARATADCDVAVIEGVMGLFDGYGDMEAGSTAQVAKWLSSAVILVLDARAIARSAAAIVHGYASFDPDVSIAGVILNRVGSASHLERMQSAIAPLGIPLLGGIPRSPDVDIPRRHLGLWLAKEDNLAETYLDRLADLVDAHLDIPQLLDRARSQPVSLPSVSLEPKAAAVPAAPVRIGLARDEAFCFYYADNLRRLQAAGAELVPFSPLRDRLPDGLDGLYLGGGYPELHAERLSQNHELRSQLHDLAQRHRPIYAECGGLMSLSQGLITADRRYGWMGLLPFWVTMGTRPKLGYCEVTAVQDGLLPKGAIGRGHRFHYSDICDVPPDGDLPPLYQAQRWRVPPAVDGYAVGSVWASYVHLHFASHPAIAPAFVQACRDLSEPLL